MIKSDFQNFARTVACRLGRESFLIRSFRPVYETLLHLVHGRRGIPWEINGANYRIDPHYRDRFGHQYDPAVADFLASRVKPGAVCFDVGANVGVYVLQLARWSGATGRVVAFEPNPKARSILQRHLTWNAIDGRVSLEAAAVSSTPGVMKMFVHGSDGMSRLNEANPQLAERAVSIDVPVTTLSEFCVERQMEPDCVVLDVEGFEIQALIGFEEVLNRRSKEIDIVMEMHPNVWPSAGTTEKLAREVFARLRFTPLPLSGQADPWSEHGHIYCKST